MNRMYAHGQWRDAPEQTAPGDALDGPAVVSYATTVIERLALMLTPRDHLVLERLVPLARAHAIGTFC